MNHNELLTAAESIYDGWFSDSTRIDWQDFMDRLERYTGHDLGSSMVSPEIRSIQAHVRRYKRSS